MNLKEADEYSSKLKKAEKSHQLREERASSGRQRSAHRRQDPSDTNERQRSAGSRGSAGQRRSVNLNEGVSGAYQVTHKTEADARYSDPLGPQAERPRTAARRGEQVQDDFENEELGDDLLPD